MNNSSWYVSLTLLLSACNGTGSNRNIRNNPTTTSQAALANLDLAIEYIRRGNYDTALDKLDRAHAADPGYFATHNVYGLLYQQLGDNQKAEKHFIKH